jgi:hypothetical protein
MHDASLRWIAMLGVVGFPFLLIYASGLPRWIARAIGDGILCYSVTLLFTGYAVSPKAMGKIRSSRGKDRSQMSPRVSALVQILCAALAVFFWWIWAVPYAADVAALAGGNGPTRVVGRVCRVGGAIYGLNLFKRSVYLCDGNSGAGRSYTLLYSIQGPEPGGKYELTLLPRSRMLLDAKEIQ